MQKKEAKRLLGAGAGLIFKGTGFYITDYKKKSGGSGESKSGGEAKSSGEGKSSSSSGSSAKS